MDKIRIIGGTPLSGKIPISGAKNAALPLMAACLLSDEPVRLSNVPYLRDITTMAKLLGQLGVELSIQESDGHGRDITLNASHITRLVAPYDIVRTMRASVLVLGPLLARFGDAKVSLPGGCAIGTRPIDIHLDGLEKMGAKIELEQGYVHAKAPDGLKGAEIHFRTVSVGATENLLMAAALADGRTVLRNAAREPEIGDLAHLLINMGAKIEGIDSDTLTIEGCPKLTGANHHVIADRIECGSYMIMAGITDSDIELVGADMKTSSALIDKLVQVGIGVEPTPNGIRTWRERDTLRSIDIVTEPYPDFPTDMQAQMMALLTLSSGTSHITETIFENRYMHVPELMRMGADIDVSGQIATIHGVTELRGAEVMATDLRASVSLVIAALAAQGETVIHRVYHLDRGYERLEEKLSACGATIERIV